MRAQLRPLRRLNYDVIAAELSRRHAGCAAPALSELPQPAAFYELPRTAALIAQAIAAGQKIAIVGDYDVDGVVATAILSGFFEAIGYPVLTRIPNRFSEGYGISAAIVDELAAAGVRLIITVDNGISAHAAAERAAELGIALIISDHHEPGEALPKALAVIDPKRCEDNFSAQSGVEVCGAQVAWWLAAGIKQALGARVDMAQWLDILCLAITADMMPMRGLNLSLMRAGLAAINASQKPFVRALRARFNKQIFDYNSLSFLICPLLNSSGRMADAADSLAFLRARSDSQAAALLEQICAHNERRKATEAEIFALCCEQIDPAAPVKIAAGRNWCRGVIGVVAGRLAAKFSCPAVVFSVDESGLAQGSARSSGGVDLLAMFEHASAALEGFGGHKGAAGVSARAERLGEFARLASEHLAALGGGEASEQSALMGELAVCECTPALLALLESYEPFGCENERPQFAGEAVVASARLLKERHLKLSLLAGAPAGLASTRAPLPPDALVDAICFNYCDPAGVSAAAASGAASAGGAGAAGGGVSVGGAGGIPAEGATIKFVYTVAKNDFYNPPAVQLIISSIF